MQSSVGIRERIDHVYPSLRPAERAVAQYIRDHIEEAADLTVGQMADIAHVSQPTVIRFARKLGFGGYRELRYVLRHPAAEHKVTFNPLAGFDLNPWDGEDEIPGKAAYGAKALIDELHSALDPKAYRKAVALLAESEFIDIFGVENSLTPAMDLFTKLGYLGLTCRLNTDAYLQQIGAGHLPPRRCGRRLLPFGQFGGYGQSVAIGEIAWRENHRHNQCHRRAAGQLGRRDVADGS